MYRMRFKNSSKLFPKQVLSCICDLVLDHLLEYDLMLHWS